MAEGPVQINMYGIRYFIDGDLSDPHVKKLMVQARNDLQQMKDRNINNIPHIWLNKPNAYKVVSQFGIDSAYINVPFGGEQHRKIEWEEKKERKDIESGLYPAFEIFDSSKTKIGYAICLSGTFAPPYHLIITNNVIGADISKEALATARENNPAITVDPFYFPVWKYYYADYYGGQEFRPFDTETLEDKEISRGISSESDGEVEAVYTDIACKFEELLFPDDDYLDQVVDIYPGWDAIEYVWIPLYGGDPSGDAGNSWWFCDAFWEIIVGYNGHNYWQSPLQYVCVTHTGWDRYSPCAELAKIPGTECRYNEDLVDFKGSYYAGHGVEDCTPEKAFGGHSERCYFGGSFYYDELHWAWTNHVGYSAEVYGGWCEGYGCWDEIYNNYAVPFWETKQTIVDVVGDPRASINTQPIGSDWWYYWEENFFVEGFDQDPGWSNAKDVDNYCGYFDYGRAASGYIREKIADNDPRVFAGGWTGQDGFKADFSGIVQDDVYTDGPYRHSHYIEVNGFAGIVKKVIHEGNDAGTGIYASDVNLRYYKLGEEPYWVLGTLWLNNPEWDYDQLLHIVYKSGQGFLEDTIFWDERKYGPGDVWYLYEIDESLKAPNGGPVLADGSFRLIQVVKETKYPDEIKKYEQQLY